MLCKKEFGQKYLVVRRLQANSDSAETPFWLDESNSTFEAKTEFYRVVLFEANVGGKVTIALISNRYILLIFYFSS